MKRLTYYGTAALGVAALFVLAGLLAGPRGIAQVPAAGGDVAVCDVADVFDNYDRRKDDDADFARRGQNVLEESKKRAARIQALEEELSGFTPGDTDHEDLLQEINRQQIEAQAWQQYKLTILQRDKHRLTGQQYDDILDMIETVASEQGYKLVLFRESRDILSKDIQQLTVQMENRKVLYSSPSIDITQTVLARLNRQYKANQD